MKKDNHESKQIQVISDNDPGLDRLLAQEKLANILIKAKQIPKHYADLPNAIWTLQKGHELGMTPIQSLEQLYFINGKSSMQVEAMMALVYKSNQMENIEQFYEGEFPLDNFTAVCKVKRVGFSESISKFSVLDAKQAKLWVLDKNGTCNKKSYSGRSLANTPWAQYPKLMLKKRVQGFAMREVFPDIVQGLYTIEEAKDLGYIKKNDQVIYEEEEHKEETSNDVDVSKIKSFINDPTITKSSITKYIHHLTDSTGVSAETIINKALSYKEKFVIKLKEFIKKGDMISENS